MSRWNRPRGSLLPRAVVLAGVAALLAACGGAQGGTSAAGGTPTPGGQITVGLNSPVQCADPHLYQSNAHQFIIRNVFDSLVDQRLDTGAITPWLASSWDVSPDGKTYTFHLRNDVTFSDGSPLTAAVVKDNFDKIMSFGPAKSPWGAAYLQGYDHTDVVDAHTAAVVFKQVNVQFLQGAATTSLSLVSEGTLALADGDRCAGKSVGSGPFTIATHSPGVETDLKKRTGYNWASPVKKHQGDAYLDTAVFKTVTEPGVRSGQLKNGEIDVDTIPLSDDLPYFQSNPGFGLTGRIFPGMNQTLLPNLSRPITSDVAVRQAMSLAINRQEIVSGLLTSFDKVPGSLLASDTPNFQPINSLTFDPNKAKALLDQAGWVPGPDGVRVKNGQKLSLVTVFQPAGRQAVPAIELVQQQLSKVGIALQIRQMSAADATALQKSGDFDVWFTPSFRADPDIVRSRTSFYGDNLGKAPAARPVDDLLVQQAATTDPAARQQIVTQAMTEIIQQGYAIPLYESAGLYAYNSRVHDLSYDATSLLTIYDTWVSGS